MNLINAEHEMKLSFRQKIREKNHESSHGRAHMFHQDMQLRFLPVRFARNNKYRVFAHGNDSKYEEVFKLLASFSTERRSNNKKIVETAFKHIFKEFMRYGEACFQIEKTDASKHFICQNNFDRSVIKKLGFYWLKQSYGDGFSRDGFEYTFLRRRDVWHIKLPRQICSPSKHRRMLKFLKSHNLGIPKYFIPNNAVQTAFDVVEYNKLNIIGVLKSTKHWGWDGRYSFGNDLTEYHRLLLKLKQHWALTLTREHIENEINQLSKRLGYDVRLRIYGLHDANKMELILEKMEEGQLSFEEGYKVLGLTLDTADL